MGKSSISMAIFHCYVSSPEGIINIPGSHTISGRTVRTLYIGEPSEARVSEGNTEWAVSITMTMQKAIGKFWKS